jgi:hypothetical protein
MKQVMMGHSHKRRRTMGGLNPRSLPFRSPYHWMKIPNCHMWTPKPPFKDTWIHITTHIWGFHKKNLGQKGVEIRQTLQLDIINTLPLNELPKDKNIELQGMENSP